MKENLKPYVYKQLKSVSEGIRLDSVLFVERSGELLTHARLRYEVPEPKGNRVLRGRSSKGQEYVKIDPKPGDLSMSRMKRE